MDHIDKDFGKILKNNAQNLRHELLPAGTDCFRVYDRNLSGYPVSVDIYGLYAKVTDYGEEPLSDEDKAVCLDICSRMLYLEKENVIYAYRAKRAVHEQHEKTDEEAVTTTVHENGLSFFVDLTTYVDTGLFLDHMVTRSLIRERSANADVLNLFSYTGSFSVYAAAGLANSVTSVDMSATYTRWAEKNLRANGYSGDMYRCVCEDANVFVRKAMEKGQKYDIIIFDPPSFSNSRKMEEDFDVSRDYADWIRNLFSILKKTGIILFSTNLGTFRMDRRKLRGLSIKEITGAAAAPGFVKGRTGTARSWMMAFDDESLSLDWSEPEKKSEKSTDKSKRRTERDGRRGERAERSGERRPYGRERSERTDRPYYRDRNSGDRPAYGNRYAKDGEQRRSRYSDNGQRFYGHRSFDDNRPYRERSERAGRSYGRNDRFERPERPYSSFRESGDRPERRDRPFRREGGYDRNSRPGTFRRDDEGRGFERKFKTDRPDRSRGNSGSKKPFGYESFKPARSREDSTDFFWNSEDLDSKKKD